MNEYELLIQNDPVSPINNYSYGERDNLTAQELYIAIFAEETCKRLGVSDVTSVIAFIIGQPFISTRQKFYGATPGTSIASLIAREILDINLPVRIPTLTNKSILALRFSMTRNLGAIVGRWIPQIGVAILAYDVIMIDFMTTLRFNRIVTPDDRLIDGTVGTLG